MGLFTIGVYLIHKLQRIERAVGTLYGNSLEDQRARELKAAYDMATGITYMRQALAALSPEQAREFYQQPARPTKPGNKAKQ